jgi:hypothetical protein
VKVGGNSPPSITDAAKANVSVLEFLSNTYLVHTSGSRSIWLHASPKAFVGWPTAPEPARGAGRRLH